MPFAHKYQFTMGIPQAGGNLGSFSVESCDVSHHERGDGTISYPIVMVLAGRGGKNGVKKAIREHLDAVHTTFSGYGNPYQLVLGRFEVESLGDGRYRATGCGIGVRIHLERELRRFCRFAELRGAPASQELVEPYLDAYKRDITRKSPELPY